MVEVYNFFQIGTLHHLSQPELINGDLLGKLLQSQSKIPKSSIPTRLLVNTVHAYQNPPLNLKRRIPHILTMSILIATEGKLIDDVSIHLRNYVGYSKKYYNEFLDDVRSMAKAIWSMQKKVLDCKSVDSSA
jgi:hypothetical protein